LNVNAVKHKSQLQIIFFIIILIIIFSAFQTIYTTENPATPLYLESASKIMQSNLPYRDFFMEYPPFSFIFFLLPRIFTADYNTYGFVFQLEVLLSAIVGLFVINNIARRVGQPPWKLMIIYTIGILAVGPIMAGRFDMFPAIMVLLSVYLFWLDKHEAAWGILALATMTKIYPAIIAPLFLISYIRNRQFRLMRRGIIVFALVSLIVLLPFLVLSPNGLWSFFTYHANRGLQVESIYSSVLLLGYKIGCVNVCSVFNFGSWNIEGPVANTIAAISTGLMLLAMLMIYLFFYKMNKPGKADIFQLGSFSFLAIITTLVTSKVLSPEYLIWLIPFLPLIARKSKVAVVMFAVAGGLSYLLFNPIMYIQLVAFFTNAVIILALRNFLLIAIAIAAATSLRIKPEDKGQTTTTKIDFKQAKTDQDCEEVNQINNIPKQS
jgi:hypothetical protein